VNPPLKRGGSGIMILSRIGLSAGDILTKAVFKCSDKPKFKLAFIDTILFKPCKVKCSLFLIIINAFLKSS